MKLILLGAALLSCGVLAEHPDDPAQYYRMEDLLSVWEDASEFWHATELMTLLRRHLVSSGRRLCERDKYAEVPPTPPARRHARPACRGRLDEQACPQCPRLSNFTTCELFRDSCQERRVAVDERESYCAGKYGEWKTTLMPADYKQCRCCDECVFYREKYQSCALEDELMEGDSAYLPVEDLRAGCNPYKNHTEQKRLALTCHPYMKKCVPESSVTELNAMRRGQLALGDCQGQCHPECFGHRGEVASAECDPSGDASRRQQNEEPCEAEVRRLKERFGPDGHLHHSAPQCTPLWLYAPVQCRSWLCYCALEDGRRVPGVKVPRAEASKMYCDCARDRCRNNSTAPCDGYGNYLDPAKHY